MRKTHAGILGRIICLTLCAAVMLGTFASVPATEACSDTKTLTLSQAKKLGLANSTTYKKTKSKIALKEVEYSQAVKALQLKKKTLTTFSWSPLLSFHFPEQLTLDEESEFAIKPTLLTVEITQLQHQLTDNIFASHASVASLYVKIYSEQQTLSFKKGLLDELNKSLTKNKARAAVGLGTQSDVEKIEKSIKSMETSIASLETDFLNDKQKLTQLIKLDISSGYRFVSPYIQADIDREGLKYLIQYTLDHDQSYYEAKLTTQTAALTLDTNYGLLKNHVGKDINIISSYVNTLRAGGEVDNAEFKLKFQNFLDKIDSYWKGKKRICLFIKVPRLWFKGSTDGSRYIEDEPYVVYENALEYKEAVTDQINLCTDLTAQVTADYESLKKTRVTYVNLVDSVAVSEAELKELLLKNQMGLIEFEEYSDAQSSYEELQMDMQSALEDYSSLLYSFDRLTCGGVSAYFKSQGLNMSDSASGSSYIVEEAELNGKPMYFIQPKVEDNLFEFSIFIPDDFEVDFTEYELLVNETRIGERTAIDQSIRHLKLVIQNVDSCKVVFYDDDGEYIGEAKVDPNSYSGDLNIEGMYTVTKVESDKIIGTYSKSVNSVELMDISFEFEPQYGIAYYKIATEDGTILLNADYTEASEGFTYLQLKPEEFGKLRLHCYDSSKAELFVGEFDTDIYQIIVPAEE